MSGLLGGIVLAAGHGTRMRSTMPKVLFPLLGLPLLEFPLRVLSGLGCPHVAVVIGSGGERVREVFGGHPVLWAWQDPPRGTGDAARIGLRALTGKCSTVVILNGDLPLLEVETLEAMLAAHADSGAALTLLTVERDDPEGYGRIVRGGSEEVLEIVEEADADAAQRRIAEVNGGVYVAEVDPLLAALEQVDSKASPDAEVYLPAVVGPLREAGLRVSAWRLPRARQAELQQVNDRVQLAAATRLRRFAIVAGHQVRGVTIVDPDSTIIEEDVVIGEDTLIHPFCVIRAGVQVGSGCEIGPFTHLRTGTSLEDEAEVGNFTETKNTRMGKGSKAKHLSYLGDGDVGELTNIGAGTIFANYDGVKKSRTVIGDEAFVGSGTIFVAPVEMGAGAKTGAGAVVPRGRDIPPGEVVVGVPARKLERRRKGEGDGSRR